MSYLNVRKLVLNDDSLPIPQSQKTATLDYIHTYSFESYLNTITINKRITVNQEGKPTKIINQRPTKRQRADKTRHRSKSEKVPEKIIIFTYYY